MLEQKSPFDIVSILLSAPDYIPFLLSNKGSSLDCSLMPQVRARLAGGDAGGGSVRKSYRPDSKKHMKGKNDDEEEGYSRFVALPGTALS